MKPIRALLRPSAKPSARPVAREHREQVALVRWLNAHGVCFCHVPNGGKRSITEAVRLKASGVKAGVPDILIFSEVPNAPYLRGVAIELKAPKTTQKAAGRISPEQELWAIELGKNGWAVKTAYGFTEAVAYLLNLGF